MNKFVSLPQEGIMNRKLKNQELGRTSIDEYKSVEKHRLTVILDNIRSLNNIGSVFRTSDAFLVEQIYLCGITAQPPHRDIQKTALGATESVNWSYFENTASAVHQLKDEGYEIIAIEQTEECVPLNTFTFSKEKRYAIVLGNEVKGVAQEIVDLCDLSVEIPQFGTKHSLNISVATGVVLWQAHTNLQAQ